MKTKIIKTIEQIAQQLDIQDIAINKKKYFMRVQNLHDRLVLEFYCENPKTDDAPEFRMTINEKGISFERYVYRPNHDHDNKEILQHIVNPEKTHFRPSIQPFWAEFPRPDEGRDIFYVDFGSKKVDY